MTLDDLKKNRILSIWQDYKVSDLALNTQVPNNDILLDQHRREIIPQVLDKLNKFFNNEIPIEEFKTSIDSLNKRNPLWGFRAINGQMFFNMMANRSMEINKTEEFSAILKKVFHIPDSIEQAKKLIINLEEFVNALSENIQDLRRAPKIHSIPYFISYFWQIQKPEQFPIYYNTMVQAFKKDQIWSPSGVISNDYESFYKLNYEIKEYFLQSTDKVVSLWEIEHVFWYINDLNQHIENVIPVPGVLIGRAANQIAIPDLPSSFVPPVISILPKMAKNDPELAELCRRQNTIIEKVFEERLSILFEILGYESHVLGQGHGRVPDGVAISEEYHYAIIYDAKVRQNGYSMGTDERAIREYITHQSESLRRIGIRNLYFMIISSSFNGNFDAAIRRIKIDTHVNEVILVEINALIAMVEGKLKDSMVTLGPDGLQSLLAFSGVLTPNIVNESFGV